MTRHADGAWGDPPEGSDDPEPFEPRDTIETFVFKCCVCSVPLMVEPDTEPGDIVYCEPCHDEVPS